MKTCRLKQIVVGIVLMILLLGLCLTASGAARHAGPAHAGMREPAVHSTVIR